jgi:type II secretory pathway component PulC
MENRERTKLFIVIGLAVIFIAVGYFRFLHGKITFFKQPERGAAIPAAIQVPAVDLKGIQPAGEMQKKAPEGPRARLRDIFAPVKPPPSEIPPVAVAVPPKPLPPLQLTGTIIGGKRPLAIINGRFLRQGERIDGFEVVSIAGDQVILSGEGRKVRLNTLTGAGERLP